MFSTSYSFALIQQPSIVVDFAGSAFSLTLFRSQRSSVQG